MLLQLHAAPARQMGRIDQESLIDPQWSTHGNTHRYDRASCVLRRASQCPSLFGDKRKRLHERLGGIRRHLEPLQNFSINVSFDARSLRAADIETEHRLPL